jgi:hypothetical protein
MSERPNAQREDTVGKPVRDREPADAEPADDPRAKIDPAWETSNYYAPPRRSSSGPRPSRSGDFTPMTWAMIVVAGILLGFAVAMTFAGG